MNEDRFLKHLTADIVVHTNSNKENGRLYTIFPHFEAVFNKDYRIESLNFNNVNKSVYFKHFDLFIEVGESFKLTYPNDETCIVAKI